MITYKDCGVDKSEGYKLVQNIKDKAASTHNKNVLNGIGSFGAFYQLTNYKEPVLVSGTDGVGTKIEIAMKVKKYDTVGQDCFAMCANDVLCHGAKPLFFLDYLACGKLDAETASQLVGGLANACKDANCALIGGETAEMPGFYKDGDYDIAGFCVGVVEKSEIINGEDIKVGDVIIALPSSGIHSNGFSLVRKLISDYYEIFNGKSIWETLLEPTKIYVNSILKLLEKQKVNGMAHITGGGLIENLPRIIPEGLCAYVQKQKIKTPEIFNFLREKGVKEEEMWGTFNMGVGFVLVISKERELDILKELENLGESAYVIGKIISRDEKICLE